LDITDDAAEQASLKPFFLAHAVNLPLFSGFISGNPSL
jgi:hypothetical protein